MASTASEFFNATTDILTIYIPVIGAVKLLVQEIYHIYENAECNKELCLIMVDRVKAAEFSMEKIIRSIEKKKEDFRDKSYYLAFERFKNNLTQIKEYTKSVSKLKGYKRFLHATDVKNKFDQLRNDFDRCMADLNFAVDVSSAIDREDESERVDKALKEVEESLKQLDDKLDESFKEVDDKLDDGFKQVGDKIDAVVQRIDFMQMTKQGDANKIDSSELSDPMTPNIRGKVFKMTYKSLIEVACKPIDGQNENELAILGKLGLSPQILKFYGHSLINNSKVMIFEWAERGNLKELYEKHDIPWTRKIQVTKDILLGLLFLRTVNVYHHDVRCENVLVLRDLSVKLGNFGCAREVDGNSRNLSQLATYIVRWMAPELIKKYIGSQDNYENKKVYTFNCEMFSFGMFLWELCYEKLPYANMDLQQIADHVLKGKREKISTGNFKNSADKEIQLEFIKIIQDAWSHRPELRITIPTLRQKLEELSSKFPIPDDAPALFKNEELDLDGQKTEISLPEFDENPEIEDEIPDEEVMPIIPLKDGIDMHKKKDYKNAWECFKQNAEVNNPIAKFWLGYYFLYGHHGEKDSIKARQLFKEAADDHNYSEAQCRYAVLLLGDLNKVNDETIKDNLRKEILRYFELAAENPDHRNADAMYYLGDIYITGKLKVNKDEERGVNYLKLAANNNNDRAISKLKELGKWVK